MKLRALTVSNFRCYKIPFTLPFDGLTTLIGRNDAGKSTLLEALDIFFNEKGLDKNDASKGGASREVTITCVFDDLPVDMVLDETATSTLSGEFLLNANGLLEITKVFNCSLEKPKLTTILLKAVHPTAANVSDLLVLKIDELKERAKTVGVDLTALNKTVKHELRSAIRSQVQDLKLTEANLVLVGDGVDEKSNAAKVWDGLKSSLPLFALFKSDRQSSDQDVEAQDPLKLAIKDALATKAAELQAVMSHVEQEVKKVVDLTLSKLREMDPGVAATLDPKFDKPNWSSLIKASITGDEEIPLNKRGSGVRRLILLNFFRAKVERAILEKGAQSTIYAVEEPETSQHPHNQRLLMRALQQLACGSDQVLVTTHTPTLARALPSSSLRFLSWDAAGQRSVQCGGDDAVNAAVAASLGVLPDHAVKVFVIVEGVHDITFLKSLSKLLRSHGEAVPDLDALEMTGELVFVPAGGANNLALWASRLHSLNRPEFHLYDRDSSAVEPPKHQAKVDSVNQRSGCKAVSTTRREVENFIHHEAVNACANDLHLPLALNTPFGNDLDVPAVLVNALNQFAPASSKWGQNRVKAWLAEVVLAAMTPQMVAEVDPLHEMQSWLNDIDVMLRQAA